MDYRGIILISGVLTLLTGATIAVEFFRRRPSGIDVATLSICRSRVNAWWLLFSSLICAILLGTGATILFFGAVSFWALREYVTLTPTRPSDHKTIVGVFFLLTPLQFFLVGVDSEWFTGVFGHEPYFYYSALIPSLAFLILPAVIAMTDDTKYYLERIAKLQVGLLICVYSLSFAPALLTMELPMESSSVASDSSEIVAAGLEDRVIRPIEESVVALQNSSRNDSEVASFSQDVEEGDLSVAPQTEPLAISSPHKNLDVSNVTLLFVFVFLTQISDVAQYFWSLAFPKHKVAPNVNSHKTYEGLFLGILTTAFVAIALGYFMPFNHWAKCAFAGVVVSCMGFAGNITVSAIKRDQGVGDFERLVDGHNGALDRIDSLCFAAPVFFHYVRICC